MSCGIINFNTSCLITFRRQFFSFLSVFLSDKLKTFMKNALYFSFMLLICFSASCKKEKDEIPSTSPASSSVSTTFFPLTTGSYWVYERFQMDTNGVETLVAIDSSYISGDTIINGATFSVFVGTYIDPNGIYCRRDSSGYIIDQYGTIHFSSTNFIDTLRTGNTPGYYNSFYKMVPASMISTPAGALAAIDYLGTINIVYPGYLWGNTRYTHCYYSDSIGLIRETRFFLMNPNYDGRRLVRYNIN